MNTSRTADTKRRNIARAYFARAYGANSQYADDALNRYDQNYNGMRDHWDRVLPFVLGTKEIPLNERRGQ
jgi:hypothetical protein